MTAPSSVNEVAEERRHLKLPEQSDVTAMRWAMVGVAIYLMLSIVFVWTQVANEEHALNGILNLLGLGEFKNITVTVLVVSSLLVTFAAMRTVFVDIRRMRPEESDIGWVERKGRPGIMLVFATEKDRERMFAKKEYTLPADYRGVVESLVDDRVRRMNASLSGRDAGGISPEEFRLIAEKRTASFGSFARFAASLLLLFAVLGTFAGIKTALPGLIKAVSAGGGQPNPASVAPGATGRVEPLRRPAVPSADVSTRSGIASPLQAVADAFGGNALALIGAIALGIMSQGLTFGRRNLLERLELVSSEYIYRGHDLTVSNPIEGAVRAMQATASEIRASNGALLGIHTGLEQLGDSFQESFRSLEARLTSIAARGESDLYNGVQQSLTALQSKIGALSDVVAANAGVYTGLVELIGARAADSKAAIENMQRASQALDKAVTGMSGVATATISTLASVATASDGLVKTGDALRDQLTALTGAVTKISPEVQQFQSSVDDAMDRISRVDTAAAESWRVVGAEVSKSVADSMARLNKETIDTLRGVGTEISKAVVQSPATPREAMRPASGGLAPDAAPLLREIVTELRSRPRTRRLSTEYLALAIGIAVLLGVLVVLSRR